MQIEVGVSLAQHNFRNHLEMLVSCVRREVHYITLHYGIYLSGYYIKITVGVMTSIEQTEEIHTKETRTKFISINVGRGAF